MTQSTRKKTFETGVIKLISSLAVASVMSVMAWTDPQQAERLRASNRAMIRIGDCGQSRASMLFLCIYQITIR